MLLNDNYEQKYLKYKKKYLELKKEMEQNGSGRSKPEQAKSYKVENKIISKTNNTNIKENDKLIKKCANNLLSIKTNDLNYLNDLNNIILVNNKKLNKLSIEIVCSYITELIGTMDNTLPAIQNNLDKIINESYNDNQEKIFIDEIKLNKNNIKNLKIIDLYVDNDGFDGKLYDDLFNFVRIHNNEYLIEDVDYYKHNLIQETIEDIRTKKSIILNLEKLKPYANTLINIQANVGVHWIYIDNNCNIHNPYNYNMQKRHSHQFCQTYALLMALIPSYRKPCDEYNNYVRASNKEKINSYRRICAYKSILILLKIILPYVIERGINKNNLHIKIVKDVKDLNIEKELPIYHEHIKKILDNIIECPNNYNNNTSNQIIAKNISSNVLAILNSQYAIENIPDFE